MSRKKNSIDKVILCSNRFVNTMTQEPTLQQLIPLVNETNEGLSAGQWDYIYEPEAKTLLDGLLTRYIEALIFQAVLENGACEQAAKMIAMKNATENAGDLIKELELLYNNVRQLLLRKSCLRLLVVQAQFKESKMSTGTIKQIIGAVIDVEYDRENIPSVYEALKIESTGTILEVQQQLGDGVVRAIAMGPTEGVKADLVVERTNAPISVPVGKETLGRIMDVLGNPIDEAGPIGEKERQAQFIKVLRVILIRQGLQ